MLSEIVPRWRPIPAIYQAVGSAWGACKGKNDTHHWYCVLFLLFCNMQECSTLLRGHQRLDVLHPYVSCDVKAIVASQSCSGQVQGGWGGNGGGMEGGLPLLDIIGSMITPGSASISSSLMYELRYCMHCIADTLLPLRVALLRI